MKLNIARKSPFPALIAVALCALSGCAGVPKSGVASQAAQVAIYTEHWEHVALLRRILLRMRSWQNYIFMEGH